MDEHLRQVADALESNTPPPVPSLASTTSDQVRQILEAAERSVSDVHARANEEASEHVARVQEATTGMLAKLDQLESQLNQLLGALRTSGERLNQGLAELQSQVAGGSLPDPAPAPAAEEPAPAPAPAPAPDELMIAPEPPTDAPPEPADDAPANGVAVNGDALFDLPKPENARSTDEAGARLIALNMALSGSAREDTALFLAEHFDLPDLDALLDDVYAKAGS